MLVSYYIKGLPTPISMWVKRAHKNNLQENFAEEILVEKDMLCLRENPYIQIDQPSTSRKKQENLPKPTKQNKYPFEMDNMKNLL